MITTYDNVKLKLSKKVLKQMKNDVKENRHLHFLRALKIYWDTSKMTLKEKEKIKKFLFN
jgi:hypothetical protein